LHARADPQDSAHRLRRGGKSDSIFPIDIRFAEELQMASRRRGRLKGMAGTLALEQTSGDLPQLTIDSVDENGFGFGFPAHSPAVWLFHLRIDHGRTSGIAF
jgi:hypothetical protein